MKKTKIKNRIQRNILITAVVSVLLSSIAVGLFSVGYSQIVLRDEIEAKVKQITISTSTMIESWMKDRQVDLKTWCRSARLQAFLEGDTGGVGSPEMISQDYIHLQQDYDWYEGINFAGIEGDILAAAEPEVIGKINVADREYFKEAMTGNIYVSEILTSRNTGNPIFVMAAPVYFEQVVSGVGFNVVDAASFTSRFISTITAGKEGYVFLYQSNGIVFAHPNHDMVLQMNLNDSDWGNEVLASSSATIEAVVDDKPSLIDFSFNETLDIGVATVIPLAEINTPANELANILLLITIAAGVIFAVLIFFLTNYYISPLRKVIVAMKEIAEGNADLTMKMEEKGKHEITQMGIYFNTFLSGLAVMVKNIQNVSGEAASIKENLVTLTEESAASSNEIASNIKSIEEQITELDNLIVKSASSVKNISEIIDDFDRIIGEQSASVSESSAAIEEMFASIKNVSHVTDTKKASIHKLIGASQDGREKISTTNSLIQVINSQVDRLSETNNLINQIATQTNLLSMNAAIEAAHAGEYGKGFAVVAGEIRKLAELASENAKNIGEGLKEMIANIQKASEVSSETFTSFQTISDEVTDVAEALEEISHSVTELSRGSEEIMIAVNSLNDMSISVREGSGKIKNESGLIDISMKSITDVSTNVVHGVKEIAVGTNQVNASIQQIREDSENLGENVEILNNDIKKFTV